jgi:hypothetical protein
VESDASLQKCFHNRRILYGKYKYTKSFLNIYGINSKSGPLCGGGIKKRDPINKRKKIEANKKEEIK